MANDEIKANELAESQAVGLTDQILTLTDAENNTVQLATVETFLNSVVNSDDTNSIQFLDGKLYVNEKCLRPVKILPSSGSVTLESNTINRVNITGDLYINLPNISTPTVYEEILVQVTMAQTHNVTLGTSHTFNDALPSLTEAGHYNLIYEADGANWYVGIIKKGEIS